ncbi:MAG: hypothetical protein IK136_03105 [Oscillospiraceae bacterium]|nr:hypothetical protein [Oscillospiraceae bacterium]
MRASDENGMVSMLGIGILCMLTFFGAAIYGVTELHSAAAQRFLVRSALRNAAEDGVRLAFARVNEDASAAARAEAADSSAVSLADYTEQGVSVSAYARKQGGRVLLLGVSKKGDERARAVAVLVRSGTSYVIDHWEH